MVAMPLFAQEPAPNAASEAAPAELVAQDPQSTLAEQQAQLAALQTQQFEALTATDQKQDVVLSGLSEQINTQRTLLQDSKTAIQEQTLLYEQSNARLAELGKQVKEVLLANSQLNETIIAFNKNLATTDEEAAQKGAKLEAFVKEFGRLSQEATALAQGLDTLTANLEEQATSIEAIKQVNASQTTSLVETRNAIEQSGMNITMLLSELMEIKSLANAQIKLRDEQASRLALELAQTKLELTDYKKMQELGTKQLVTNIAAGMVLLFLCLVVLGFISKMNAKRLKTGILSAVHAKLNQATPVVKPAETASAKPKKRAQR